jgi:hypothetical protein
MPWTLEEIEREWLGGEHVQLPPEDVVRAFDAAEYVRGREWVLSTTSLPGGGHQWGFAPFLRVYSFGHRVQAVSGAPRAGALLQRLLRDDAAAESELTAIYLLRSRHAEAEPEIEPEVMVGDRCRHPDFRIRSGAARWTYVEVTQLNRSVASEGTQEILRRLADHAMSILHPFVIEVVFWRDPAEGEEDELATQLREACAAPEGERRDIRDIASVMVKSGDPSVVIPSILPKDDGTRMSLAQSIVGPGQPNRQIVVRAPFADQRAEVILAAEARQLPKDESGLVMVDVSGQPTALDSLAKLVPPRFTPTQHSRIGAVLLFMTATMPAAQGMMWLPFVKLIMNPHASVPLPEWITAAVEEARSETRRLTGRPD